MNSCSEYIIRSSNVLWGDGCILSGIIHVKNEQVFDVICDGNDEEIRKYSARYEGIEVMDVGDKMVMPGVIDCHVHVNEPGRTEWEGFKTATMAAAAGGITTIVDMPLNCIPSLTTMEALKLKVKAAMGKCHIDVSFWGGIVPDNLDELKNLVNEGIPGFKSFMTESGVEEFKCVNEQQIEAAMDELKGTDVVMMFHAEVDQHQTTNLDPCSYAAFLETRPASMEVEAINIIISLCRKYRVRCHIVHLSSSTSVPLIQNAKAEGLPLTVETCHHYLNICSEDISNEATHFKCCPPIRNRQNQNELWKALEEGIIDMVVSDHSPCTPDLKDPNTFDFLTSWGGISSVQFGLLLMWTGMQNRGLNDFKMLHKLMCKNTSKLCKLDHVKGCIKPGMDADLVVWDPYQTTQIKEENIYHRNKLTPYIGRTLRGKIHQTYVRGKLVYNDGGFAEYPTGKVLLKK